MLCRGSPVSCSAARLLCSQKISSNYGFDAGEGNLSGKERRGSGEMALLVFSSTWLSRETAPREGGLPAGLTDRQTDSLAPSLRAGWPLWRHSHPLRAVPRWWRLLWGARRHPELPGENRVAAGRGPCAAFEVICNIFFGIINIFSPLLLPILNAPYSGLALGTAVYEFPFGRKEGNRDSFPEKRAAMAQHVSVHAVSSLAQLLSVFLGITG